MSVIKGLSKCISIRSGHLKSLGKNVFADTKGCSGFFLIQYIYIYWKKSKVQKTLACKEFIYFLSYIMKKYKVPFSFHHL